MFHNKAWNTPKASHPIPPFLRSLSQFIQRSLAIETQPGTFQPKQTFFPQRSLSQSYQKRFAQNIPPTFQPKQTSPSAKHFSAPAQPPRYTQTAESTPNPISKRTSLYSQPPRHTDNKITSTL